MIRAGQPGEETSDGPFQPPNHETSRHLEQAKKMLDDGRYSDGLQMLDEIMQKDEDYFLPPEPGQSSHRGLKEEVQRLISQQPAEGLQAYETLFGAKAQHMLSDALAANDIDGISQVARRYFNTKAGNDATLLVGLSDLDHNQPLAAALCLERLHDVATGAGYEPSLTVLLAYSWLQGGQESRAKQLLIELKRKSPGAKIRVGDKSAVLFADDSQAIAWLTNTLGKDRLSRAAHLLQWAIFRGDPSRNASSDGGSALMDPRWRVSTTDNPPAAISSRQANLDHNIPIMPVMQPLAVANVVLMRTARRTVGHRLRYRQARVGSSLDHRRASRSGQFAAQRQPARRRLAHRTALGKCHSRHARQRWAVCLHGRRAQVRRNGFARPGDAALGGHVAAAAIRDGHQRTRGV